jgi:alkanesulfonate monooxygenase SsuD/methylene tetrahydromethanopterin reductase-like flavin-dependent oxidoreductase (luciferase family)
MSGWLTVQGVQLECIERGHGRPILWLHGEEGLDPAGPVLDRLATYGHLLAPSHPGFGHSPEAASVDTVDDLAYLYLDLLAQRSLGDAVVVGNPDSVYRQIMRMYEHVGGFGQLLMMGQAGFLDHEETMRGMQMFSREVYPRLKEL